MKNVNAIVPTGFPRPWVRIGLTLAIAAGAALLLAPLAYRLTRRLPALALVPVAIVLGLAALSILLLGFLTARRRGNRADARRAAFGILFVLAVLAMPIVPLIRARATPAIHDITTDPDDPPQFVAVLPARAGADNPVVYGGAAVADEQRRAYPDLRPLHLDESPASAFSRALAVARDMGWLIVAADASAGRVEATDRTRVFGFMDDVAIRVRSDGTGSRVDVRSLSRVGRGDMGTNAKRIATYISRLAR
jgi:uncharacterized protein (DUF1499 family)